MSDTTLSKEEKQYKRLTEEPVARLILELGLPTTISMLITNLYNMVDTWFVSQLGTSATGAVGVVFGLMAIIQAFGFMFGHGAGSNISRLLGAHEKERAKAFSATGFYLAVGAGVLIAIIGIVDLNGLCRLLGSTETILPYARIYAFYILVSAPAMASSCVMNNVLRYEGYANLAMVGLVSGGILNMAGDAILMWGLNLGIRGAALSTMISQYISFGILLFFFLRGKTQSSLTPKYFTWEFAVHKNIITAGFPSMMRQGLNSVSTMVLNAQAAVYGDIAIAAMSVVSRIFNFVFSVALGIGQGFQPVSSFNYGAKKYARIRKGFLLALVSVLIFCLVISAAVFGFADTLMGFFTNEGSAISAAGAEYLRVEGAFYVGIGILFLLYGYYRAVDKPVVSVVLTIISLGTRVLLAYALTGLFHTGVIGIWMAIPIGWGLADLVGMILLRRGVLSKHLMKV